MLLQRYKKYVIWNFFLMTLVFSASKISSTSNFYPLIDKKIDTCSNFYDAVCKVHETNMKNDKKIYDETRDSEYIVNKIIIDEILTTAEPADASVDLKIAKKLYKQCIVLDRRVYKEWTKDQKKDFQTEENISIKNDDPFEAVPERSEEDKSIVDEIEDEINSFTSEDEPKTLEEKFQDSMNWIGRWPMASEFCNSTSFDFASAFAYLTMSDIDPLFKFGRKGILINDPIIVSPGSLILQNPLYYNEKEFPDQVVAYRKFVKALVHSYREIVLRMDYHYYYYYEPNLDYHIDLLFQFESKLANAFLMFRASNADEMKKMNLSDFNENWNRIIICEGKNLKVNWENLITGMFPTVLIEDAKVLEISVPKTDVKGKVYDLVSVVATILDSTDPYIIADYYGMLWAIQRGTLLFTEFRNLYRQFTIEAFGKDLKSTEFQCASIVSKYMDATIGQVAKTRFSNEATLKDEIKSIHQAIRDYLVTEYFNYEKDAKIIDGINNTILGSLVGLDREDVPKNYYEPFGPSDDFSMEKLLDADFLDMLRVLTFIDHRRRLANYFRKDDATYISEKQLFESWKPNVAILIRDQWRMPHLIAVPLAVVIASEPIRGLLSTKGTGLFSFIGTKIVRALFAETAKISSLYCDGKEDYDRIKCYNEIVDSVVPGSKIDEKVVEDVVHKIISEVIVVQATFGAFMYYMENVEAANYDTKEEKEKGKREFFQSLAKESCALYEGDMSVSKAIKAGEVPMRVIIDIITNTPIDDFMMTFNCTFSN